MSRTQDAATIRGNVGTLVGWATSNTAMRADLAKNAVTLIEAGLSGLLAATTDEPGLRAAHHQHVHRDGCHRWFDHNANQLIDLAGPAGWCDGCTEDWPCDTTRALNRAALALIPAASDGSLDDRDREVERIERAVQRAIESGAWKPDGRFADNLYDAGLRASGGKK